MYLKMDELSLDELHAQIIQFFHNLRVNLDLDKTQIERLYGDFYDRVNALVEIQGSYWGISPHNFVALSDSATRTKPDLCPIYNAINEVFRYYVDSEYRAVRELLSLPMYYLKENGREIGEYFTEAAARKALLQGYTLNGTYVECRDQKGGEVFAAHKQGQGFLIYSNGRSLSWI